MVGKRMIFRGCWVARLALGTLAPISMGADADSGTSGGATTQPAVSDAVKLCSCD